MAEILGGQNMAAMMGMAAETPKTAGSSRRLGEFVTVEQAISEAIPHAEPPEPASVECEFCGKRLWRRAPILLGMGIYRAGRWLDIEHCDCWEARAMWAAKAEAQKAEAERVDEEKRQERQRQRIQKLIGESGMGRRFQNRTFETFRVDDTNRDAYNRCVRYAETFTERRKNGDGLFFTGGVGTGKTHLAAAITNRLIGQGVPVIILTMQRILDCIKDTYDEDSEASTSDVLTQFRTAPLLVIDDLGKEMPTGWAQAELNRIVNDRYEQMNPVIVTANYGDEALIERLGSGKQCDRWTAEAIVSRLHETTTLISMTGKDWRSGGVGR